MMRSNKANTLISIQLGRRAINKFIWWLISMKLMLKCCCLMGNVKGTLNSMNTTLGVLIEIFGERHLMFMMMDILKRVKNNFQIGLDRKEEK